MQNNSYVNVKEPETMTKTRPAPHILASLQLGNNFTLSEVTTNPYTGVEKPMEVWLDDADGEYWVDPKTDRLIQYGLRNWPANRPPVPLKDRLMVAELRMRAMGQIETIRPDFGQMRRALYPLEDNMRRQTYFFRFDDFSKPVVESELPPFIQVAISAEGKIVGITDTLG